MGMSFVTLGLAAEFGPQGVAVNALWPRTVIATDALNMIPGVDLAQCRKPEIMADAAHAVLTRDAAGFHGRFLIDEEVLREAGVTDFAAMRWIRRSRCCRICFWTEMPRMRSQDQHATATTNMVAFVGGPEGPIGDCWEGLKARAGCKNLKSGLPALPHQRRPFHKRNARRGLPYF